MTDVEMSDSSEEYHLSAVFDAHKSDIRAIQVTGANEIITGGRDESVRFFAKRRGVYSEYAMFPEKGQMVNSLAYIEAGEDNLLFVGLRNGAIVVYKNGAPEPLVTHQYHKSNVSCLYADKVNMKLISGSWDNSVIVWPIDHLTEPEFPALQLVGHSLSVWSVTALEKRPGFYLSGSADKSIKLWEDDVCVRTYNGHTDVVRCVMMLNDECFVSAANDFTLRLWHVESTSALRVYKSVVDEYIYSLCLTGNKLISCGEKGYIEVWKKSESEEGFEFLHSQMTRIPVGSAWSAAALSENDVVFGASDGKVYIFSNDSSRKAPEDVITAMNDSLAAMVAAEIEKKEQETKDVVVIKVSLDDGEPKMELRYTKGTDPSLAAETFIRENNLPISYLNEITEYIVANIPDARLAMQKKYRKQSTQKIEVDGKMYDYAMEVNVDGRNLKMPFNNGDVPELVAFSFCEKHNIPVKYAPKFAQLVKNDLNDKAAGASTEYADPFTGGGRYVPGSSSGGIGGGADPFTGSGRYVPQSTPSVPPSQAGDPFTSGGRYIPGSSDAAIVPNASRVIDKLRPRGEFVPLHDFYLFGVENLSQKAVTTLKEMNSKQESLKMNDEQLLAMERLFGASPGSIDVGELEVSALEIGLQWPLENLTVIMDLFRIALLHEKLNAYFCDMKTRGGDTLLRLEALLVCSPPDPVRILVCRSVANAFAHAPGQNMILNAIGTLLPHITVCFTSGKVALQLASASALANWSLLLLQQSEKIAELGPREDVLRAIIKELEPISSFGDKSEPAIMRMLQAIVTLMWGDRQVISLGKSRNVSTIVNRMKDAVVNEGGKNIARDIVEMMYAV